MRSSDALVVGLLVIGALGGGCAAPSGAPEASPAAATQPAGPAQVVTADSFDALWDAIHGAIRGRGYVVDRVDYRNGVITSEPLISKQAFEPWRRDTVGAGNVAESTLGTVRRTIRFDITETAKGTFAATPTVLVERFSSAERRYTAAIQYRRAFRRTEARGTPETDRGIYLPARYWYEIGTDADLERALTEGVASRLARGAD